LLLTIVLVRTPLGLRPEAKANKNKNNGYCNGYSRPRPAEATGEVRIKTKKKQMQQRIVIFYEFHKSIFMCHLMVCTAK
jgi:hypothetical protein